MKRIFKFIYWLFVGRFDGVGYTPQDPDETLNIISPGYNIEDNHIKRK